MTKKLLSNKWELELVDIESLQNDDEEKTDSSDVEEKYTSYMHKEVRLIIHSFSPFSSK